MSEKIAMHNMPVAVQLKAVEIIGEILVRALPGEGGDWEKTAVDASAAVKCALKELYD